MARMVQQNATDVSVAVRVYTAAGAVADIAFNEAGLTFQAKLGNLRTAKIDIAPVTRTNDLAVHADGGFVVVGSGFGEHRLDLPDTCTATVGPLALSGKSTAGHIFVFEDVYITPYNPGTSTVDAQVKGVDADALSAAAFSAAAVAKMQNGLASNAGQLAIIERTDRIPNSPAAVGSQVTLAGGTIVAVRDAILTWELWNGFSLARFFRVVGVLWRGKSSGQKSTTPKFTAPDDSIEVAGTIDADNNRLMVSDTASNVP